MISTLMKRDFTRRFSFLVSDVAKLYGDQFDRLARARIGLSRAQCRLLGVLAMQDEDAPLSQAELAHRLGLSAMSVGSLCDRMEEAGWLSRRAAPDDRRVRMVHLQPEAMPALDAALSISDMIQDAGLAALSAHERQQLVHLLGKARTGLAAFASEDTSEAQEPGTASTAEPATASGREAATQRKASAADERQ
jgi:DNA-binding MarR family transcriptional regulator